MLKDAKCALAKDVNDARRDGPETGLYEYVSQARQRSVLVAMLFCRDAA